MRHACSRVAPNCQPNCLAVPSLPEGPTSAGSCRRVIPGRSDAARCRDETADSERPWARGQRRGRPWGRADRKAFRIARPANTRIAADRCTPAARSRPFSVFRKRSSATGFGEGFFRRVVDPARSHGSTSINSWSAAGSHFSSEAGCRSASWNHISRASARAAPPEGRGSRAASSMIGALSPSTSMDTCSALPASGTFHSSMKPSRGSHRNIQRRKS